MMSSQDIRDRQAAAVEAAWQAFQSDPSKRNFQRWINIRKAAQFGWAS